jgi:hypothetical protein
MASFAGGCDDASRVVNRGRDSLLKKDRTTRTELPSTWIGATDSLGKVVAVDDVGIRSAAARLAPQS